MDGPRDYHTKWSKPDKDKYHMILLILCCKTGTNVVSQLHVKNKLKEKNENILASVWYTRTPHNTVTANEIKI